MGNGAWNQRQLDIYGELLDAVYRLRETFTPSDTTCRFLIDAADAAAAGWQEPDAGIWEHRSQPRHYVYSKLMCWVALDRAVRLAEWLDAADHVPAWQRCADEIRATILERGWNPEVGSFTQCLDDDQLDASALMLAIMEFLPVDDPRMLSTIQSVATGLAAPCGLIYRYRGDGMEGGEGTFLLCTYWLVECLAATGDMAHATDLFERVTAYSNDLGLLSEEAEPSTGELVGNFPQVLSHVGLVNAAWALSRFAAGSASA